MKKGRAKAAKRQSRFAQSMYRLSFVLKMDKTKIRTLGERRFVEWVNFFRTASRARLRAFVNPRTYKNPALPHTRQSAGRPKV